MDILTDCGIELEPLESWVDCYGCGATGVVYRIEMINKLDSVAYVHICTVCEGNKGWFENES